jgi:hypothetical protein
MSLINCPECNREVSSQAVNCPQCGYPIDAPSQFAATAPKQPKKKMGCLGYIGSGLLIFITLAAIGSLIKSPSTKSASSVTESDKKANAKLDAQAEKRFEDCRTKLKKAQQLEALYDLEWKRAMPKVVVGPTFYTIPIDAKQGLADTINCFLMTGKSEYIDFDLLDWQTGKRVTRYSIVRLKMD